jgi:hypothetical protein
MSLTKSRSERQPVSVTGRDAFMALKAMAYAVTVIESLPENRRENSDCRDMRRLLTSWCRNNPETVRHLLTNAHAHITGEGWAVGDNVVSLRSHSAPPSTRHRIVREIRELIDDDPANGLMAGFIRQALHEFAKDVSSADPPAPTGTIADGMWPAWVGCAKRAVAKLAPRANA